ncbi:hypothetical protein [Rothia sp. P4278]|uniref:hypothetical protein n=1 Tax=Rothia sp. P4278 TaxID=3402658 RepID=UPI003AE04575
MLPKIFESPENTLYSVVCDDIESIPTALCDIDFLKSIKRVPSKWVTVVEFHRGENFSRALSVFLAPENISENALGSPSGSWIKNVGHFSVSEQSDGTIVCDGMECNYELEGERFLAQVREPDWGGFPPQLEISHPYIWYWDAYKTENGWKYLDSSGGEHELIRYKLGDASWHVEFSSAELQRYLFTTNQVAVVQFDCKKYSRFEEFADKTVEVKENWVVGMYDATSRPQFLHGKASSFARVMGRFLISPRETKVLPALLDDELMPGYPELIYSVDSNTGEEISFTSDPDKLSNYFGKNPDAPHYLQPVYFKSEVLHRYRSHPSKYEVTDSEVSCFRLWSVDISVNDEGMVIVYLGDFGKKIPWQEWDYWIAYNVPPSGGIPSDRIKRDFYNIPASPESPMVVLKDKYREINSLSEEKFGFIFWKELEKEDERSFRSLYGLAGNDYTHFKDAVLLLSKVLVDSLNKKEMEKRIDLGEEKPMGLVVLNKYLEALGDTQKSSDNLHKLQRLRSAGGVAHRGNSDSMKPYKSLGLTRNDPHKDFNILIGKVNESLTAIHQLLSVAICDKS